MQAIGKTSQSNEQAPYRPPTLYNARRNNLTHNANPNCPSAKTKGHGTQYCNLIFGNTAEYLTHRQMSFHSSGTQSREKINVFAICISIL